ncbi:hypothetical protein D7Y09_08570 [bacterium 1XD42-1]|nr:hypothetical protein D7X25_10810 [bacterium 1XD42-8]RKJ64610.1 hypothetical protein D7Y09_08570 [bacterium 1XD42-1]
MIACFAWTNTQIVNATNARINIFADEEADLYVRMGPQISETLIHAVELSGVYQNIYCVDPVHLNYNKLKFGIFRKFRVLFLESAYKKAYNNILNNICSGKEYNRIILTWFYAENVFFVNYWAKNTAKFSITFLDEGTGSYCNNKKEMFFPVSLIGSFKERLKRFIAEWRMSKKYARYVDSICMYRPEYCQDDIDLKKIKIPVIDQKQNPTMYKIICDATKNLDSTHFIRYEKRRVYYFSTFNPEGKTYDLRSIEILKIITEISGKNAVIAKIHTNSSNHAKTFARSLEDIIFIDREKYIFEGLYIQIPNRTNKVLISVVSTTAIYPKFMFNEEPYIILTYRLYDTYRQLGVERDDRIAEILLDSYTDKSRIMIPNSMYELKNMLAIMLGKERYVGNEYDILFSENDGKIENSNSDIEKMVNMGD